MEYISNQAKFLPHPSPHILSIVFAQKLGKESE